MSYGKRQARRLTEKVDFLTVLEVLWGSTFLCVGLLEASEFLCVGALVLIFVGDCTIVFDCRNQGSESFGETWLGRGVGRSGEACASDLALNDAIVRGLGGGYNTSSGCTVDRRAAGSAG